MTIQHCLVLLKPDAVQRGIIGEVISLISQSGAKLIGAKVVNVSKELAEKHYSTLKQRKPEAYENTIKYITGGFHSSNVIALAYSGENIIEKIREICGPTHPEKANPLTIRGKYGRIHSSTGLIENVMHASDSESNAENEIKLWFSPDELTENPYPSIKKKTSKDSLFWK
jgi:nucleoside-diphosphate kinase